MRLVDLSRIQLQLLVHLVFRGSDTTARTHWLKGLFTVNHAKDYMLLVFFKSLLDELLLFLPESPRVFTILRLIEEGSVGDFWEILLLNLDLLFKVELEVWQSYLC